MSGLWNTFRVHGLFLIVAGYLVNLSY